MRKLFYLAAVAMLYAVPSAFSQTVNVSDQNRTVEVSVTQSVSVDAEIAEVTIGCLKYSSTHEQAYQENLRIADQVIKALVAAGVPKESISSIRIELGETDSDDNSSGSTKKQANKQFKARQSWTIRLAAGDAQRIIDLAVQAGANGVEGVSWDVKNPEGLETKARVAALAKAREVATEMAKGLDAKLGEVLYASNGETISSVADLSLDKNLTFITKRVASREVEYTLQLYPEKVEKSATARVIFALDRPN